MSTLRAVTRLALALSIVLGLVIVSALLINSSPVHAAAPGPLPTPAGPDRYTTMTVDITLYEWWLTAWSNNEVRCSFYVDHEGLPNDNDIASACSEDVYNEWKYESWPCTEQDTRACRGLYFIPISSKPSTREITVKMPPPKVWVSVEGCEPDPDGWCTQQPSLVLTGEEPLPNESIISIDGLAGSDPFTCDQARCEFRLDDTNSKPLNLTFWAYSSHGDSSQVFDALLRVIKEGGKGERLTPRWFVSVLSNQWTGEPPASCAAAWKSFLPPGDLPQWLTTPSTSEELNSDIPYNYLAANLIKQGVVNTKDCPGGGLNPDGSANACGLEKSAPAVSEWQNRFDKLIFSVAQESKVPAQLLKNLFSHESQFWPGVFRDGKDVGLGQLTEDGADTALLWNPSFYRQFCPLVLDKTTCETKIYSKAIVGDQFHPELSEKERAMLRGALVGSVDARCADCPLGLDLSRADFSVGVFAHTLLANCEQAGKIVFDATTKEPGEIVSYETMWRFTLVNYNAGPGCLAEAVNESFQQGAANPLSWQGVSAALNEPCSGAINYVNAITEGAEPVPLNPEPTPTPTATP